MLVALTFSFFVLGFVAANLGNTTPKSGHKLIHNPVFNLRQLLKALKTGKSVGFQSAISIEEVSPTEEQGANALLTKYATPFSPVLILY